MAENTRVFVDFEVEHTATYVNADGTEFEEEYDAEFDSGSDEQFPHVKAHAYTVFGSYDTGGRDTIGDFETEEHAQEIADVLTRSLQAAANHEEV
jgi:hypothetical protein